MNLLYLRFRQVSINYESLPLSMKVVIIQNNTNITVMGTKYIATIQTSNFNLFMPKLNFFTTVKRERRWD